jgi:DNA topoisomerase VI subunit B
MHLFQAYSQHNNGQREERTRSERLGHLLAEVHSELKILDESNRNRISRYLTRIVNTVTFTKRDHQKIERPIKLVASDQEI